MLIETWFLTRADFGGLRARSKRVTIEHLADRNKVVDPVSFVTMAVFF